MSLKNALKNKKVLWSVVGASAVGVSAITGGLASTLGNSSSSQQTDEIVSGMINDAKINESFNYNGEIKIADENTESLTKALTKGVVANIESKILSNAEFININLKMDASSVKYGSVPSFNFVAIPIDGHGWMDGSSGDKTVVVNLTNVTVNKDENNKPSVPDTNDATYIASVTFDKEIIIDNLSDAALESFFLNNSTTIINNLLRNEGFKNVNITFNQGTASIENKGAIFNVVPVNGHTWEDNTVTVKTIKVMFSSVKAKENIIGSTLEYRMSQYGVYSSSEHALGMIFNQGAWSVGGELRVIADWIERTNPGAKVESKLVSYKLVDNTHAQGVYKVTQFGVSGTVTVNVSNFRVTSIESTKNVELKLPSFGVFEDKQTALDYVFSRGIFGSNGNRQIEKMIEQQNPYIEVVGFVSSQLIDNESAEAFYKIKAKDGYTLSCSDIIKVTASNFRVVTLDEPTKVAEYTVEKYSVLSPEIALGYIFKINGYEISGKREVQDYLKNTFKYFEVGNIVDSRIISSTMVEGTYPVTPKPGFKWQDGTTGQKLLKVNVTGFTIKM